MEPLSFLQTSGHSAKITFPSLLCSWMGQSGQILINEMWAAVASRIVYISLKEKCLHCALLSYWLDCGYGSGIWNSNLGPQDGNFILRRREQGRMSLGPWYCPAVITILDCLITFMLIKSLYLQGFVTAAQICILTHAHSGFFQYP